MSQDALERVNELKDTLAKASSNFNRLLQVLQSLMSNVTLFQCIMSHKVKHLQAGRRYVTVTEPMGAQGYFPSSLQLDEVR